MFLPPDKPPGFLSRAELHWLAFTVITATIVKSGEKVAEKLIEHYWPEKKKAEEDKP